MHYADGEGRSVQLLSVVLMAPFMPGMWRIHG
jgi:hypothetical protein